MAEKNVPEIRFAGFSGNWERFELGELGDTFTGLSGKTKDDFGHGNGKFITYMNVYVNSLAAPNGVESIEIDSRQNEVHAGDVLFTTSSETPEEVGMSSVWLEKSENIYLNSFCFGYRLREEIDSYYLAYMLRSPVIRRKISFLAQGISRYNISKNKVMQISIPKPPTEEQTRIGTFFRNLDNLITLHQRKYDKLVIVKKSMLEKMFPKDGADVPEIRFAGFSGAWEKRKIGDITTVASAARVHKEEWTISGVPFFRSSDVVSAFKGTKNEKAFISHELFAELSRLSGKPEKNDVLVTGGGSIGIPYLVPNDEPLYSKDADLIWIKSSEEFDGQYLFTYFATPRFREYVSSISHIGTIAHYTIEQVKETSVFLPHVKEQTAIGSFFRSLDNLITLHQQELEKLKNIKKSLLDKMFV